MGWVRARRKLGGWLALLALALQLALSFGHVHAEEFAAANPAIVAAQPAGPGGTQQPSGNHDDCPICVVIHLAGTLLLPAPPAIPLPASFAIAQRYVPALQALVAAPAASFQARAPPQA